jgi:antitoxin (DNA-binding transcriptional repressor) of toxin-antitoxin stability system
MKHVPIKEAGRQLEQLVAQLRAGEQIVLTEDGEPVAELRMRTKEGGGLNWDALEQWKRELGVDRLVTYIAKDFDDPLPEDFLITPER